MACEFLYSGVQSVDFDSPVILNTSIPCNKGYVYHENETGNFILRGIVPNQCNCYAHYQATFNGNIAIPEGGAVTPIAISLIVNGEQRITSRAIYTPAAVENYGNVTSTAIIKVPRGCCFNLSLEYISGVVDDPATTPTPTISVLNPNLTIARIG